MKPRSVDDWFTQTAGVWGRSPVFEEWNRGSVEPGIRGLPSVERQATARSASSVSPAAPTREGSRDGRGVHGNTGHSRLLGSTPKADCGAVPRFDSVGRLSRRPGRPSLEPSWLRVVTLFLMAAAVPWVGDVSMTTLLEMIAALGVALLLLAIAWTW